MKKNKKLVDLIYLDTSKLESDLKRDHQVKVDFWLDWINQMMERLVDEDIYIEEQIEYFMVNNFLKSFLIRRFHWIRETITDPELRTKYLLTLPPFNQHGSVKRFLLHFFQFKEDRGKKAIQFNFLTSSEREVRALWDIHKLIKTLATIDVLKKYTSGSHSFPSIFPRNYIVDLLDSLSGALKLLVEICVKPDYLQGLMAQFPIDCFEPESILMRKETSAYLINDMVLEKFDYRNYFFHIFFRPGLKANYKGKDLTFRFNYLDFEIIRQEFLINWINNRLRGNQRKLEVFGMYKIGDRSFQDVIEATPEMELTLLKRLPKSIFDDLIAEVNEAVADEDKSPVDPMSEKTGEFARQLLLYEKAKKLASKSVSALRRFLSRLRSDGEKVKQPENQNNGPEQASPEPVAATSIQVKKLKKSEIDFPYFCKTNSSFSKQMKMLQTRMPADQYSVFNKKVRDYLSKVSENTPIKRRTPRHEWAVPFLILEGDEDTAQLLILGAEAKSKQLSMSYGSGVDQNYDFKPYFVYGSLGEQYRMGNADETRKVKGKVFQIYSSVEPRVIEMMMKLLDQVIKA